MKRLLILLGLLLGLTLPTAAQLAFSPGTLATPTASPVAGSYAGTQTVTLSDASTTNSFICYTTDSSTPTGTATSCTNGTHYTVGISISSTTTLKAAAFEGYWRPSGVLTAVYTITSGAPSIAAHALNASCGTTTCNLNITWPSGTVMVLYQIVWFTTDVLSATPKDCAGSATCGSSTDTLVSGQACTVNSGTTECSYYICTSALASGASNFTAVFTTMTGTAAIEVYALSNVPGSGCYDTGGTSITSSSNSGTVTTSGNVSGSNELTLALTQGSGTVTAGTGYTSVDNSGSKMAESSNSSPSSGATTTATWSGSGGGNWQNVIDVIK